VSNYDSEEFNDFVKYLEKQNVSITIPEVGDDFPFGGARFKIVGPVAKLSNHNDVSLVLRLVYGSTSFLFTGDAERQEEYGILTYGSYIKSNVLKVGHHGSNGSTSAAFLKKVSPEYAVISVGSENVYGFPEIETLNALRNANVKVFRTDLQGTIVCKSDRNNLTFSVERNPNIEVLPTPSPTPTKKPVVTLEPNVTEYVLNKNTKKFHYPSCSSVDQMKEKNKLHYVGTREEVIRRGYEPCGRCYP
jgi:competence protein ComEC